MRDPSPQWEATVTFGAAARGVLRFLNGLPPWLAHAKYVAIAFVGVFLASVVAVQLPIDSEARMRWLGMLLQLAGLLTVLVGVFGEQRVFERPTYRQRFAAWWKLRPTFKQKHAQGSAVATGGGTFRAEGKATANFQSTLSSGIDARFEVINARLGLLNARVDELDRIVESQRIAHQQATEAQRRATETAVSKVDDKLLRTAVGGIDLQVVGLAWLAAGLIIGSLPRELGCLYEGWVPLWMLHARLICGAG